MMSHTHSSNETSADVGQAQLTEGKFRSVKRSELCSTEEANKNKTEWDTIVVGCKNHADDQNRNGGGGSKFDYQELHNGKKETAAFQEMRVNVVSKYPCPGEYAGESAEFKRWRVQWASKHPCPEKKDELFEMWRDQWIDATTHFFTEHPDLLNGSPDQSGFLDERIAEQTTNMFYYLAESESDEDVEIADVKGTLQARLVDHTPSHDLIEVRVRPARITGPLSSHPNNVVDYSIEKFYVHKSTTVNQLRDEIKIKVASSLRAPIKGHVTVHIVPSSDTAPLNCMPFGDGSGCCSPNNGKECMPSGTTRIKVTTAIQCGSEGGMESDKASASNDYKSSQLTNDPKYTQTRRNDALYGHLNETHRYLPPPNVEKGSFDLPTDLKNILHQYSALHDRSAEQSQALTASLVQQIAAQSQLQSAKYANDRFEKSIRQDMLDSIEMLEPLGVNAEGNGNRDVNLWVEQVRQHCSHLFNEQDLRGKLGALVQNEKQVCPASVKPEHRVDFKSMWTDLIQSHKVKMVWGGLTEQKKQYAAYRRAKAADPTSWETPDQGR